MKATILWFRQDLRLRDNPALQAALHTRQAIIPVYIHDLEHDWSIGAASQWWLHHSLLSLQKTLRKHESNLLVLAGPAQQKLLALCKKANASHVFWNRCYEPHTIQRDKTIKQHLRDKHIEVESFNGSLLVEPWHGLKKDATPYRVFTPFWKAIQQKGVNLYSFKPRGKFPSVPPDIPSKKNQDITSLKLMPRIAWDSGIKKTWQPGETAVNQYLDDFLDEPLLHYPEERDIPATRGTSRLAPYLHFGEISPWQLWQTIQNWGNLSHKTGSLKAAEAYLRQLGWREFSYHLLYHFPHTTNKPLDERFRKFPWNRNYRKKLQAWQKGLTGIPIVDAGMRELWHSGWMHNRVRMIVASLLSKNLLIPWQQGAKWFWDTLVDADLANNTMGWQWTAGCGADAAPFFRIFNPVRQGQRFDPKGIYVRHWVPELKLLPDKWIHQPWAAPDELLKQAGVVPGKTYPKPIVDLAASRERALAIWNKLKN